MISASADGTAAVFNQDRLDYVRRIFGHCGRGLNAVSVSSGTCVFGADDGCFMVEHGSNRLLQRYIPQLVRARHGTAEPYADQQKDQITAVLQDESDQTVLTAGTDGAVRVYDRHSGMEICTLRGHESAVLSVCKLKGLIISGGQDGRVVFSDLKTGMALQTMSLNAAVSSMELSPNGGFLLVSCLGKVCVFRLSGWAVQKARGLNEEAGSAAVNKKQGEPIGAAKPSAPQAVSCEMVREFAVKEHSFLHQACWAGKKVLYGGEGRLLLLDIAEKKMEEIPFEGEMFLTVVSTSMEDGRVKAAAGTKDGRVYVFDL